MKKNCAPMIGIKRKKLSIMSNHTCEIILIVALLVVLGVWYYTSFHNRMFPNAAAKASLQGSGALAQPVVTYAEQSARPFAVNDLDPNYIDAAYANRMAVQNPMQSPALGVSGDNVVIPDLTAGRVGQVGDAFSTFPDAPTGVNSTMWGSSADNATESVDTIKTKYNDAAKHQNRFQFDKRNYRSTQDGQRRLSRYLGARGGATHDMMAEFLGVANVSGPKVDCSKIRDSFLPEWHPCFEALGQIIEVEDQQRDNTLGNNTV